MRLPAGWRLRRQDLLGSAGFFGVVVTLAACAVDPAVYSPYLTPKRYGLLLVSAAALLLWATGAARRADATLRISAIEAVIAASIVWGMIANRNWPPIEAGTWPWLPIAAFILTLVVRQRFNQSTSTPETPGVPLRVAAVADLMTALWIVGLALAAHSLGEAFLAGGFRSGNSSVKTLMTSVIGTPNGFGAFMAAGIMAALASWADARRRGARLLLAGAALVQGAALVANGSRGALLGLAAAGLLVLWLRLWKGAAAVNEAGPNVPESWRRLRRRAAVFGLAFLAAFAVAGFLLHRLNPASGRGRLIAWEISGAMLADQPFTGVGTGRFAAEWGRYQIELWRDPDHAEFDRQAVGRSQPNSELFHRLSERGLPGGALYVMLWVFAIGFLVRALLRDARTAAVDWGLLGLLVAILVHSLLDGAFRWEATLVTAHLAFGLVPAPSLLEASLRRPWSRRLPLVAAMAWAATVAFKATQEYPGYRIWSGASRSAGAERLELLMSAQQRVPWEGDLLHDIGITMFRNGRFEEAADMLQRRLEVRDNAPARVALAEAQLSLGWLAPAEANARRAAAGYPDRLAPRLLLGRIHHARGEEAQARVALAPAIRRDTYYQSTAVDSLATEATRLWRDWYDDEPPR